MMIYLSKTGTSIPFSEESYKEAICDQCVNAYRTVKKSRRYYNDPNRILPGAIFIYEGKQYVLAGRSSGGKQYRAFGCGIRNFSAGKSTIVWRNTGLVYVG